MTPLPIDLSTVAWAVGIGVGTFFSPCGWALIPAYVGYFAGTGKRAEPVSGMAGAIRGARFGLAAGLGALGVLGSAALVVALIRRQLGLSSAVLGTGAVATGLVVGTLLVALGVLMLADRLPTITVPLKAPQRKDLGGMVAFGAIFALGSVGCTLPVFIGLVAFALSGAVTAAESLAALLAFALTVAGLLVATSILLAVAKEQAQARVRSLLPYVKPASGLLLVAAGVYVVTYYVVFLPA